MKFAKAGAGYLLLGASLLGTRSFSSAQGQDAPKPAQGAPPASPAGSSPDMEQLKSPDAGARSKAVRELGKSGDPSSIPELAVALKDPVTKVRHEAVLALASIHSPQSLQTLLGATQDTDSDVRTLAVQSVVGYYTGVVQGPGFTGTMRKEFRRAKRLFNPDKTQVDPGTVLDPKAVSALEAAMGDTRSLHAAREAAKGLGVLLARSAVPALVTAAHSFDEELARESLNSLAKIKDLAAGPQLADLLNSPYKDVARDAAVTVGILKTHEALPKLQAMLQNDPDAKNREKAMEGLAYLGDPVSVPLFIKELWNQDNKSMRAAAAEGLARAQDPKSLPELGKALGAEKDARVRLAMQFAVTALGKNDNLSSMVEDLSGRRGDDAEAYLTELARNPKFLPALYPYLSSHDATVRRRLCTVLMLSGDDSSLEPLDRLTHDSNGDVATAAMRARQSIRPRSSTVTH